MASTYSPLKIELITTGEQSGTWGTTTNVNLGTAVSEAITGSADVTFASANVTLTLTDTNGTQTARNLRLRLTGTTGGARDLIVPNIEKQYIVQNDTANTVTIKNSTGTGVAIPSSVSAIVFNDGVNITSAGTYSTSVVTPLLAATDAAFVNALPVTSGGTGVTTATGTGSVVRATSPTLVTPALGTPTSGVLTNATGLPLSTGIVGTLGVTNGGTGVTTSTGSGSNVLSTSPTLVTPILGTPTSGTLTNCTGLPVATGVSGLGTGVATFLATPSSANLAAAVTGETGTGALVFGTSPTLVTPVLGTPASGTLTSCTGLPISTGVSGLGAGVATFLATPSSANLAAALTDETGTGSAVFATSPTLVTPALGTPSALVGTNITGTAAGLSIGGNAATATLATNATTAATATNALACSGNSATATKFTTTSGTAPAYAARAWAYIDGFTSADVSGTYSQSGTTVTVTISNHGLQVGHYVQADITSGTAVDGLYAVTNVSSSSVFTYTAATSLTTSGNITLSRVTIVASGNVANVTYVSAGVYIPNFTASMPSAAYAPICSVAHSATSNDATDTNLIYFVQPFLLEASNFRLSTFNYTGAEISTNVDVALVTFSIFV